MAIEYVKFIRISEKSEFENFDKNRYISSSPHGLQVGSSRDVFHRVFQLKTTVNSLGIFPTEQRHLELFVIQKGF